MTTSKNFPIGISDFRKIIQAKSVFVDKTLFVKDIMDNHAGVILITRPRRFGKTLNMSILKRFLELEGDASLFDNLEIQKHSEFCETHQNKYPIIFVSFKDIKDMTWESSFAKIKEVFSALYHDHMHLIQENILSPHEREKFQQVLEMKIDNPAHLGYALSDLIKHVSKYYKTPPVLLLDEYDTPIHSAYASGYYDQTVSFMRTLLGSALKYNIHLGKAVLTGIMRVSQESLFSGLNNIEVHSVLDETYASYFGFTENEVISLLPENIPIEHIRDWYNGYSIGDQKLYNPWSIINCLKKNGQLKPYWINTSDNALVFKMIETAHLQEDFEKLIEGGSLRRPLNETLAFSYLENDENAVWSLLLHSGYLTVTSLELDSIGQYIGDVVIPNQEVMSIYVQMVRYWFSKANATSDYFSLLESLEHGDAKTFVESLRAYIQTSGSYFDFGKNTTERVFHVFMLGLLVGLRSKYKIHSNKEAGLGRFDMLFIPKDEQQRGIVLEFKICKTPEELETTSQMALTQISTQNYTAIFAQENIKEALCIGLAFCGKEVMCAHSINLI